MQNNLKQIPIGIDSFKKLIERNCYFVDKSLLIKKLVENTSEVILFTRPRRFGKTLNFSMLKCFLEIPECRMYDNGNKRQRQYGKSSSNRNYEDIPGKHIQCV